MTLWLVCVFVCVCECVSAGDRVQGWTTVMSLWLVSVCERVCVCVCERESVCVCVREG